MKSISVVGSLKGVRWSAFPSALFSVCLAGAIFVAPTVAAQPGAAEPGDGHAKPAWEWTVEERLAERFEPVEMRRRVEANVPPELLPYQTPDSDSLVGRDHPELFLPTEVFRVFTERAFDPDRQRREGARSVYARVYGGALELDDAFWRDLSILASELLVAETEARQRWEELVAARVESRSRAELEGARARYSAAWAATCGPRAEALARARDFFGREAFDRLLYEAVAPSLGQGGEYGPDARAALLRRERGCVDAR